MANGSPPSDTPAGCLAVLNQQINQLINYDGRNYIFLQLSVSNSYNFISKYKNAIEVVPFTCVYDPGDVNVGEPVGELVDIDNAVEVLAVELVANLPLDPLVLGSENKPNIIEQQFSKRNGLADERIK